MKNRTNVNPSQPCHCHVCLIEAVSIPGTKHRRCGGGAWKAIRSKRNRAGGVHGVWVSGAAPMAEAA